MSGLQKLGMNKGVVNTDLAFSPRARFSRCDPRLCLVGVEGDGGGILTEDFLCVHSTAAPLSPLGPDSTKRISTCLPLGHTNSVDFRETDVLGVLC